MKRLSIPLRVMFTLLVIAVLAACAPGETPPSAEEVAAQVATSVAMTVEAQAQIATSVAQTVEARESEAAAALPTATQTETPLPTLTPVLASATPVTLVAPSGGSGSGGTSGGGGGYTQYEYSCDIIRQRPRDNTEFKRNSGTFDVSFVILNNGTATWAAGKDVVLLGDPGGSLGIAPGTLVLQLGEMKPGDTSAVIGPFDATVPEEPGHYVIDFKVEGGWCYPYVAFNVVR